MIFIEKDIEQIKAKGISVEEVESQIQTFKEGIPFVNLKSAAIIGSGILQISESEKQELIKLFNELRDQKSIVKFVPASGAATRMFKFLFEFIEDNDLNNDAVITFFDHLEKQSFYKDVLTETQSCYHDYGQMSKLEQQLALVKTMLDSDKLDMSNLPKGLLPFHNYEDHVATAFEEHLYEAAYYASSSNNAELHFTVSPQHITKFKEEHQKIKNSVESETGTQFSISYSTQDESTDTIAVNIDNTPFKDENENLLFRPSGHGALINNLNSIEADIVFVKNIDNVVARSGNTQDFEYKKLLAGKLIELQEKVFFFLNLLEKDSVTQEQLHEIVAFVEDDLNCPFEQQYESFSRDKKIIGLKNKLNRPIRVCGMVKNEGEPGGGPFVVKDLSGKISLQIVESSQINKKDGAQLSILKNATHFNPVDLVCGVKNYEGEKFDLLDFIDENTGFISEKTRLGKPLKALERPGLWNGSMAHWITIFVEVPLSTFNPVKTVNDLLKPAHQTK